VQLGLAIALVGGCFSPHPPAGAPCDPSNAYCPSGQTCIGEPTGYFCETHAIADASDSSIDAQTRFVYTATVAECVNPKMPDPDRCKQIKGADQLVVDMVDATTGHPWDVFIRFDLDSAFAINAVQAVTLELTVTSDSLASSANSGVVWQVAPFTLMALYTAEPAQLGNTPIAPSQGKVMNLQVVSFPLPTSLVAPAGSVYLGMTTPSTDGANYWNLAGVDPPRLVIDAP